jgi:hypothetical protein
MAVSELGKSMTAIGHRLRIPWLEVGKAVAQGAATRDRNGYKIIESS